MIESSTQERLKRLEDAAKWALDFIKVQSEASGETEVTRMIRVKLEEALSNTGGAAFPASIEKHSTANES